MICSISDKLIYFVLEYSLLKMIPWAVSDYSETLLVNASEKLKK